MKKRLFKSLLLSAALFAAFSSNIALAESPETHNVEAKPSSAFVETSSTESSEEVENKPLNTSEETEKFPTKSIK